MNRVAFIVLTIMCLSSLASQVYMCMHVQGIKVIFPSPHQEYLLPRLAYLPTFSTKNIFSQHYNGPNTAPYGLRKGECIIM